MPTFVLSLLDTKGAHILDSLLKGVVPGEGVRTAVNLSIADTLGPDNRFVVQRFPLLFSMHGNPIWTHKSVIERFLLLVTESITRGSTAL